MILSKRSSTSRLNPDTWVRPLLAATGLVSILALGLIVGFLVLEAWPVFASALWPRFLLDDGWYPLEGAFSLMPMIWATLAVTLGAMLLATPLGLLSAVFECFFITQTPARIYRLVLMLLAGIPSVVYGLWGLTVLVPLIGQWQPPGSSLLAAVLVLALMILPTVALTAASALESVPGHILSGAAALGMTRAGQIIGVVLPAARRGIASGMLLATARALGETMAVLMVAGNVVQTPGGLFEPVRVLTANLALEMPYATGTHRAALFASGLLLTLVVVVLAWLAARRRGATAHVV